MKYLILSTSDVNGGAAIAAYRLHQGMRAIGHESRMLVGTKLTDDPDVVVCDDSPSPSGKFTGAIEAPARTDRSSTYFSAPWIGRPIENHPLVSWADVINVHWVAAFLNPLSLRALRASGKPVILTLHDERAYTGGCHYAAGCEGYLRSCGDCPQLVADFHEFARAAHEFSAQCLSGSAPPHVVAPSRWLSSTAARGTILKGCAHHVIPYGIDLTAFRPTDQSAAKAALGFPEDGLLVLVGSQFLSERRKGIDLFLAAIVSLLGRERFAAAAREGKLAFAAFGQAPGETPPGQVSLQPLGELSRTEDIVTAYNAADLFICPSREDNLPNTVMEAMACGTPVLGTRVGGIPDMVEDEVNGFLVPPDDAKALAAALERALADPARLREFGARARAKCEKMYPLEKQAAAYAKLAQNLLHNRPSTGTAIADLPCLHELSEARADQMAQRLELLRLRKLEEEVIRLRAARATALDAMTGLKAIRQECKNQLEQARLQLEDLRRGNPLWRLSRRYYKMRRALRLLEARHEALRQSEKVLRPLSRK
jgi:glycosyltransferase involved in cell wall biosynthesis